MTCILPERYEEVLKLLSKAGRPMLYKEIVNEMAPKLNVSPSTIEFIVRDLVKLGHIEKISRGLYRITEKGEEYLRNCLGS